jgi:thiol:disulfide interchange protein DsbG
MKTYFLATCLAVAPGLARAEPHCSLPSPPPAAETTNLLRELPSAEAIPRVMAQAAPALPLAAPAVTLPQIDPARRSAGTAATLPPALQHIVATGAAITDMGDYHGLRRVVARTGDQFMLLTATPDGQAVVAGLMSDLSAADLSQIAGGSLTELGMLHGLRGLLVKSGTQFQVFYATPDGERVIPGVMWDAVGKNLTRDQVAPVAGIVPTVTIGPAANAVPQSTAFAGAPAPKPVPALDIVKATSFGTIGSPSAPRLWMFIDPLCSFSVRAMQQLQPFVTSGRVQLAVIPLAVIDHETNGHSTTNALAMLSRPIDQMVTAWSRGDLGGAPIPEATARLQANMAAAQAIRLEGTPTLIWRNADGSEGRSDGLPSDLNAVLASLGS